MSQHLNKVAPDAQGENSMEAAQNAEQLKKMIPADDAGETKVPMGGGDDQADYGKMTQDQALNVFAVSAESGLSDKDVEERLQQYGKNVLESHETNKFLKFMSFLWNPLR
eukprot:Awhi_evm1s8044